MSKLCLGQTAGLIEKHRRETDFLIIALKTIVYSKGEKSSCEKELAKRRKFFDQVRLFQNSFSFNSNFSIKGVSRNDPN